MARDPRTHTFARLADLYRKSGRLERALEVVEEGLVRHPHYLNAQLVRARVLRELGRTDEAASAFRLVLEIDGDNLVAREALESLAPAGAVRASISGEGAETSSTAGRWLARLEADWRSRPAPAHTLAAGRDPASEAGAGDAGDAGAPDESAGDAGDPDVSAGDAGDPDESAGDTGAPGPARGDPAREPAPPPAGEPRPAEVPTATLASLYLSQGLFDEAIGVFEKLLARDPYNARLAQGLEEARRRQRPGSGPAARAPEGVANAETAPRAPSRSERGAPGAQGGPPTGRTDAVTIREFLGALLEGRAEVPDETPEGWRLRLERWLGGEGDDSRDG